MQKTAFIGRQVSVWVHGGSHETQSQHDAAPSTCGFSNLADVFRLTVNVSVHGEPKGETCSPKTVPLDYGFVDTDGVTHGHVRLRVGDNGEDKSCDQRQPVPLAVASSVDGPPVGFRIYLSADHIVSERWRYMPVRAPKARAGMCFDLRAVSHRSSQT